MTSALDTAELELAAAVDADEGHRPVLFSQRLAERLPSFLGSIRVRLAVLYSVILFALGAFVVVGIYTAISRSLDNEPVSSGSTRIEVPVRGGPPVDIELIPEDEYNRRLEAAVNARTLDNLRKYSFIALGSLFVGSLLVGWFVAGIVLRPIHRITRVAREIQATDLSRRINLRGSNDELRQLADTFDDMLARLDAAFESQRRFIHEASHEIRNPLAVMRTNMEVALSDPDASADDLRAAGEVVERAAARMSTLVDDLLLHARREEPANRAGLVDVAPIISEIASDFRAAAEQVEVRIDHVTMPDLWVLGDGMQLRQALANLIANAVRHSPPGSAVRVAGGADEAWIWMSVEDRGPGIAEEDRDRVWQRFWRGDRRRAREQGRSGLGLTIVKQIAERHRGRVQLLSEVGKGSTFIIWLPLVAPPT